MTAEAEFLVAPRSALTRQTLFLLPPVPSGPCSTLLGLPISVHVLPYFYLGPLLGIDCIEARQLGNMLISSELCMSQHVVLVHYTSIFAASRSYININSCSAVAGKEHIEQLVLVLGMGDSSAMNA